MGQKSCLCRSPGLLCSLSTPESPSVSPGHMAGCTQSYKGVHRFSLLVRFLECSLSLTLT